MIRYLRHNEIDREQWDRCISKSVNGIIYAYSWYLDVVAPGWEALAEDDYESVFPLTQGKKFGIKYLFQPMFTQQLGIFSVNMLSESLVTRFIQAIPSGYRFAEIQLNSFNRVDASLFQCTFRVNHELELVRPYETLAGEFSQNARRNIRKAIEAGVTVKRKVDPEDLVNLFRENFGKREGVLRYRDYMTVTRLMETCIMNSHGILMSAGTGAGRQDAAAFFLKHEGRFIFLFSASDYKTRDNGAMFLLLDTFIREHSERPVILDFEGGNDPGLARFYQGFGARETRYPMVRINRLSPAVNKILALYKKTRRP